MIGRCLEIVPLDACAAFEAPALSLPPLNAIRAAKQGVRMTFNPFFAAACHARLNSS
jgi:hypothetical protein